MKSRRFLEDSVKICQSREIKFHIADAVKMSGGVAAFFVLLSHVKKFLQVRDHLLYCSPERSVLFEVVKHLLPVFDGFNVGGNIIYKFIAVPERTEKT